MGKKFCWKIGGPAGFGIMTTGPMFAKILKQAGYHTQGYPENPSLIRGGYNCYLVTFSDEPVHSPYRGFDFYVALSDAAFDNEEFTPEHYVLGDLANLKKAGDCKAKMIDVPSKKIVEDLGGPEVMQNTVAVGASAGFLGLDFSVIAEELKKTYGDKQKVLDLNLKAAEAGYNIAKGHSISCGIKQDASLKDHLAVSGNTAVSIGAIEAGVGVFAGYPMSPASAIMHYLAEQELAHGLVVKHTEDEISAMNAVVGASFAGARAMTATSGGGLALMSEAIGLAAIGETPVVVVNVQRPGPATGMPTWTEQPDLKFTMNISQDEFVSAIFSPGDVNEFHEMTFDAFNLADEFQIPAFVLSDKFIGEAQFMTPSFNATGALNRGYMFGGNAEAANDYFPRYKDFKDGIPQRSIPGTPGGCYICGSNEHDEKGFVTDDAANRVVQQDRRFKKLAPLAKRMPLPKLFGKKDAKHTFVCWGSTKAVMMETLKYSDAFNFIHFSAVHPLQWDKVAELLKGKNLVLAETNFTGQLGDLVREQTGIHIEKKLLKYDGRPLFPEDVIEFLEGLK